MEIKPVHVKKYPIRLGQFLKLANLAQDGLEAKALIQEEQVSVNNQVETRRGRQLRRDDRIEVRGTVCVCA